MLNKNYLNPSWNGGKRRALIPMMTLAICATVAMSATILAAPGKSDEDIVQLGRVSTVFISVEAEGQSGERISSSGSGFVIHPNGYVLTAAHVIPSNTANNTPRIRGALQSRYAVLEDMELIARDPQFDFALLKFSNTAITRPPVRLGNSWATQLNAHLLALGFPMGIEFGSKPGILVGTGGPGGTWITDIALNPGDSGGPVFDREGKVVAMVESALPQAEGIKFVLPITFSAYLLKLVGVEALQSADRPNDGAPTAVQMRDVHFPVSQTRNATLAFTPSSDSYELKVDALPGLRITQANLVRKSDARLSDVNITVSPGGEYAILRYRLTSGPVYDQWRGWLEGDLVTQQVPQ